MEAALVFPIFIYVVVIFLYFLQVLYLQETIQTGLNEVAKSCSKYSFLYEKLMSEKSEESETETKVETETESQNQGEISKKSNSDEESQNNDDNEIISGLLSGAFYHTKIKEFVDESVIDHSCVIGGFLGINFMNSEFLQDGETIDVVAVYRIHFPVPFFHLANYTMVQRVKTRGFIGEEKIGEDKAEEEKNVDSEERMVYIAETGNVYHVNRECTHLKLSIQSIGYESVETRRNSSGGKYHPCEKCGGNGVSRQSQSVYITSEGDRYHILLECSGLKRTISVVPISDVGNRRVCSRCGSK